MVLLCGGVEGSAKIAMTPLLSGCATMGLLPNDVLPRLIFPDTVQPEFVNLKLGSGNPAGRTIFANVTNRRSLRLTAPDERNAGSAVIS